MQFNEDIEFFEGEELEEGQQNDPIEPTQEDEITQDEPAPIDVEYIKQYYSNLTDLGIIKTPEDFEFDGTVDKMEEALELTKNSLYQEAVKNLEEKIPDDFKALLKYALAGGKSIDAYLSAYANNDILELDTTVVENQRKILAEYYKEFTSYSSEKINKMISRLEEMGDLDEEVDDALTQLQQLKQQRKNELVELAAAEELERKQRAQEERETISGIIDNTTNSVERKAKMKDFLFGPIKQDNVISTKFSTTLRNIYSNPEHLTQLVEILLDYDPKKGLILDKVENRVKTKGVKTFKEIVREKAGGKPTGATSTPIIREDDSFLENFLIN